MWPTKDFQMFVAVCSKPCRVGVSLSQIHALTRSHCLGVSHPCAMRKFQLKTILKASLLNEMASVYLKLITWKQISSINFTSVCLKLITWKQLSSINFTSVCLKLITWNTLFCKFHFSLCQTDNMKVTLFYKFPYALWSKLKQALDINHIVSSRSQSPLDSLLFNGASLVFKESLYLFLL